MISTQNLRIKAQQDLCYNLYQVAVLDRILYNNKSLLANEYQDLLPVHLIPAHAYKAGSRNQS